MFKNFLASITHNAISLIGTAIAVAALVLMGSFFAMELWGFEGGPYLGILTYLILPMIFIVGRLRPGAHPDRSHPLPAQTAADDRG